MSCLTLMSQRTTLAAGMTRGVYRKAFNLGVVELSYAQTVPVIMN
jgi:hypothetical protein